MRGSATGSWTGSVTRIAFDLDEVLRRIRRAVRGDPPAALFALAEEGHRSVFEQLVACIVSIRTRDEVTLAVARRFFARARTPAAVARLSEGEIAGLIRPSRFSDRKAGQILAIARRAMAETGGRIPCDEAVLLSYAGVGPKCANLVLGIACHVPRVSVDVHVHRVTNRWGYVAEPTPEKTMRALEKLVPPGHRIDINRLLVPFGKHVCTARRPRCSTCPVLEYCRQVGVTNPR